MREGYLYLRIALVLTADELLKRWPRVGLNDDELTDMIAAGELPAFMEFTKQRDPEGQIVSTCFAITEPPFVDGKGYDWEFIIFLISDVERIEALHSELTWPVIDEEEQTSQNAEILNSTTYPGPVPKPAVYGKDYGPVHTQTGESLQTESTALAAKVAELEGQNDALRTELEAERAKAARTGPPEHLERAKDEKTAERWKRNMRSGLTLAVHVIKVGKAFTTEELRKVCSTLALPALGEDALKIFRETMPPECINTGGRPSKKKTSE